MNIITKKRQILLLPSEGKDEAPLYSVQNTVLKLTVFSDQRVSMGEINYEYYNLRKCFNQNSCLIKHQREKSLSSVKIPFLN